jgi:hypothetical protein
MEHLESEIRNKESKRLRRFLNRGVNIGIRFFRSKPRLKLFSLSLDGIRKNQSHVRTPILDDAAEDIRANLAYRPKLRTVIRRCAKSRADLVRTR